MMTNLNTSNQINTLDGLLDLNITSLIVDGIPVVITDLYDKVTDNTDDILHEGTTNRWASAITATLPLLKTAYDISLPKSTAVVDGYLSSTDWTTFNNKQDTILVVAPIQKSGSTIFIFPANTSTSGYLTNTDWNTFNNKQNTITCSAPLSITANNISQTQANTSTNGWLSSTDWNTFNSGSGLWSLSSGYIRNSPSYHVYLAGGTGILAGTGNWIADYNNNHYCQTLFVNGSTCIDTSRNLTLGSGSVTTTGLVYSGGLQSTGVVNGQSYQVSGSTLSDPSRNVFCTSVTSSQEINITTQVYAYRIGGASALQINGTNALIGVSNGSTTYNVGTNMTYAGVDAGYTYHHSGYGGDMNTGIGKNALYSCTSSYNTAVGCNSGYTLTSGGYNCSLGAYSNYTNTTGSWNAAMGMYSLYSAGPAPEANSCLGGYTLFSCYSPMFNVAIGNQALMYSNTPVHNVAIGYQSLYNPGNNITGAVCVGGYSGNHNQADYTVAIGYNSLATNITGVQNTGIGFNSLSGSKNSYNTSVGYESGLGLNTGQYCCYFGDQAGYTNGFKSYNNYFGYRSGYYMAGENNCGFGYNAMKGLYSGMLGYENSCFGTSSLENLQDGVGNCSFGTYAGRNISTGNSNVCVGHTSGSGITTGGYNVCMGYNSQADANGYSQVILGSSCGPGIYGGGYNYGYYTHPSMATLGGGTYLVWDSGTGRFGPLVSSKRYKTNIRGLETEMDSSKVLQLNPVMYTSRIDNVDRHIGLIAEDVNDIIPELVPKDKDGLCNSVDYPMISVLLLDVVKKQSKEITSLKSEIDMMKSDILTLKNLMLNKCQII